MDICIDFDGTCVTHEYPHVGTNIGAVEVLHKLVKSGHRLILFTMRSDAALQDAVDWFKSNDIELFGINRNPEQDWTNSPKAYGQLYIDDAALGCPLTIDMSISLRPFVNWSIVEDMLISMKLIAEK